MDDEADGRRKEGDGALNVGDGGVERKGAPSTSRVLRKDGAAAFAREGQSRALCASAIGNRYQQDTGFRLCE